MTTTPFEVGPWLPARPPTVHIASLPDALRWARAGSILNPGIQFIARGGNTLWCFETNWNGIQRVIKEEYDDGHRAE